jgi:hypothetical protein
VAIVEGGVVVVVCFGPGEEGEGQGQHASAASPAMHCATKQRRISEWLTQGFGVCYLGVGRAAGVTCIVRGGVSGQRGGVVHRHGGLTTAAAAANPVVLQGTSNACGSHGHVQNFFKPYVYCTGACSTVQHTPTLFAAH